MNTYFFFRYEFEADVNNMTKKIKIHYVFKKLQFKTITVFMLKAF